MPFINTKVNMPLPEEKEAALKARLGDAISLLGKSEEWLMLNFEDNCRMYFKGEKSKPMAFVEVLAFGHIADGASERMTAAVTQAFVDELGIPGPNVYVCYGETGQWGWNGGNL